MKMRLASFALVVAMLAVLSSGSHAFPAFINTNQVEIGVYGGGLVVGDIDNDGDLDKIVTGWAMDLNYFTLVYTNNRDGNFTLSDQNMFGMSAINGLGDIDNDSDLDLITMGQGRDGLNRTLIWTNNGDGNFTLSDQNLSGQVAGAIALGDIDNNGTIDLITTGRDEELDVYTFIYTNRGDGNFTETDQNNVLGMRDGDVILGDIDNDNDLDLITAGAFDLFAEKYTLVYTNNGSGIFTLDQNLFGLWYTSLALGDIDNDRDLDLIQIGRDNVFPKHLLIYSNENGNFVLSDQNLFGVDQGGLALGDIDNDGDLDLITTGFNSPILTIVYENSGDGNFTSPGPIDNNNTNLAYGGIALGDIDNDGDLDLMINGQLEEATNYSEVLTNNQADSDGFNDPNTVPQPPSSGFFTEYLDGQFNLHWEQGTDTETSANGLYYNLKVGTTDDANDLVSSYYGSQEFCGLFGNMLQRQDLNLAIAEQTIYWAVQTIDAGLETSAWSTTYYSPVDFGIYFADENIMANYADVNVIINGTEYTTSNGFLSVSLQPFQDINVYAYNDVNTYHGRRFFFPNIGASGLDINALMLEDVNGQVIDFQFYEADTITLLANTYVTAWKDDNYVGVAQTDASGIVSFFLNTDTNYYFTATDSAGGFIRYDSVEVTSLIPKDEYTLADIGHTYRFTIKRLADRRAIDLTTDYITYILPNTLDYYVFDYNAGPNYYDRQYEVKIIGNPLTASIQPYLVPITFSGDFIFNVIDADLLTPLSDVRIVIHRTIPGEGTVEIASITTDDAGKANISLLLDTEYDVDFYYAEELVYEATIRPTAASLYYQVALDISDIGISYIPIGRLTAIFAPTTTYMPLNSDGSIDINVSITLTNKSIASIYTRVLDSNGCVYDENSFTTPWPDANTVYYHPDLNGPASTNLYNGLPCIYSDQYGLYIEVDVNSVDGNNFRTTSIHYNVTATWQFGLEYGLSLLAGQINSGGGYVGTSFLAFFITMIAIGALAAAGVHNPALLIFIMDVFMGMFFFFGWMTDMIFIFFIATGMLLLGLTRAVFN